MNDLRFACRKLLKNPGFTAVAALILALGIGVCTAVFSQMDSIFWKPRVQKNPEALVVLALATKDGRIIGNGIPYSIYGEYRQSLETLSDVFAFESPVVFELTQDDRKELNYGEVVSGNYFSALELTPALGRFFMDADSGAPAPRRKVVISHALWVRRFAASREVIGKFLPLGEDRYEIIGVAPEGFSGLEPNPRQMEPQFWIPAAQDWNSMRIAGWLKKNVSLAQAEANVAVVTRHLEEIHRNDPAPAPKVIAPGVTAGTMPMPWSFTPRLIPIGRGSLWMFHSPKEIARVYAFFVAAVAAVFLIACAAAAHLVLVRWTKLQKDIVLRLSMGATRARILRSIAMESLLLAALGGGLGFVFAGWTNQMLLALKPRSLQWLNVDFTTDLRSVGFTVCVCFLATFLCSLLPTLLTGRLDLNSILKGQGPTGPRGQRQGGRVMVAGQLALCCVLLLGASLCLRGFTRLLSVDVGFKANDTLVYSFAFQRSSNEQTVAFFDAALDRIRRLPGVTEVSLSSSIPLAGNSSGTGSRTLFEGYVPQDNESVDARFTHVGPGYFKTIAATLAAGREFTDADRLNTQPVALINEALARRYWPGQDPIGKRINYAGGLTVVGVVKDIRDDKVWEPAHPHFYLSLLQRPWSSSIHLLVRGAGSAAGWSKPIESELRSLNPSISGVQSSSLSRIMLGSMGDQVLLLTIAGVFGTIALLLSIFSVYGVVSYVVSLRHHEFGIRVALGCGRRQLVALVLADGFKMALGGLVLGLIAGAGFSRIMAGHLREVGATDPYAFGGVLCALVVATLLAAYVPARRAAKVDPMEALRYE